MKNIQLLNSISNVGLEVFDKTAYNVGAEVQEPVGMMVRSAVMHDMQFPATLAAIARAGAGVNNIPLERCAEEGIVVFNTPGANANGVKELAILALLMASRKVVAGIEWARTLKGDPELSKKVEKGKSQFALPLVEERRACHVVLGLERTRQRVVACMHDPGVSPRRATCQVQARFQHQHPQVKTYQFASRRRADDTGPDDDDVVFAFRHCSHNRFRPPRSYRMLACSMICDFSYPLLRFASGWPMSTWS